VAFRADAIATLTARVSPMLRVLPIALLLFSCLAATKPASSSGSGPIASPDSKNNNIGAITALVQRQVQAWEKHDFSIAAGDWLPTGKLTSPGGSVDAKDMQAAMTDYFQHFGNLHVLVKSVFVSADRKRIAIEWDWDVTRLRDGVRGLTHDAIIVDLVGGKISSWREYFDFGDSVDAKP
jgi:limonene-1,2-epoxide hydrolase